MMRPPTPGDRLTPRDPPATRPPRPPRRPLRAAHARVRQAMRAGALTSAHDIAEGGLSTALAECCIAGGVGASVTLPAGIGHCHARG